MRMSLKFLNKKLNDKTSYLADSRPFILYELILIHTDKLSLLSRGQNKARKLFLEIEIRTNRL